MDKLPFRLRRKLRADANGCWNWTGKIVQGFPRHRDRSARRVVYAALSGSPINEIPRLQSSCMNPLCVNPAHMEHTGRPSPGRLSQSADTVWNKLIRIQPSIHMDAEIASEEIGAHVSEEQWEKYRFWAVSHPELYR